MHLQKDITAPNEFTFEVDLRNCRPIRVVFDAWKKKKKEMVFCYQNCSDLLWEKIVPVIDKNFWNSRPANNLQNF